MRCSVVIRAAIGAALAFPALASPPTFSHDVRPILERHCVSCHQPGDIGPMALRSYRQVRPWAAAIREAVVSRTMPPWHAEPSNSHPFQNDRTLSKEEIGTLVSWAAAGSPEGTPEPEEVGHPVDSRWKLGKPDLVVQVPGFHVPKEGVLQYTFLIVPLHFEHDTWVRAAEFRIDQRAVVHHMNAFIRPPKSSYLAEFPTNQIFVPTVADRGKRREGERVFDRRELLIGYEPGYEPMEWLPGGAKLIRAGSDVVLEMHFNPNGKAVTDRSELAFYFAKTAPQKRILAIDTLRDLDLAIPPGAPSYTSDAAMTLGQAVQLLSVQPHMHTRGKSMTVRAIYPDGKTDTLIDVPYYDFNWQTTYKYRTPVELPARTRLESIAHFDNSPNNKFNSDPSKLVRWGDQTTDEMHIAFLELILDAGANPDSLLTEAPRMVGAPSPKQTR